jgi:hypothetical protein
VTWENRLIFEVSSAPPDADFPVWVDLTSRIRDNIRPVDLRIGRQNDLEQAEPSRLEIMLDNADDALTFGNTTSPYAAWWGPGCRCRLREPHAGAVFELFDGFVEVPQEALITAGIEQRIALTAVDRLGRLENSPTFVSTLTEYIRYAGGSALKAYWPLNDADGAKTGASFVTGVGPMLQVNNYNDSPHQDQLLWGQRTGPIGDDESYVQMDPSDAVIANNYNGAPRIVRRDFTVTPIAGGVYGIVAWVYLPSATTGTLAAQILVSHANNFLNPTFQFSYSNAFGWEFAGQTSLSASWDLFGPAGAKTDSWNCVAGFCEVNTNNLWFFVNGLVATGVAGGVTGGLGPLQEIALDGDAGRSFGHIQIYSGQFDPVALFNTQYQMGLLGLERQTTGDRIRTIAQYAGLPNVETVNTVDKGQSVMQVARLAGKTPLDAMREAETTEQGLLHTDGAGHLVFKDRRTLYNV